MAITTCVSDAQLRRYADNQLSDDGTARVYEHLEVCSRCRQRLHELLGESRVRIGEVVGPPLDWGQAIYDAESPASALSLRPLENSSAGRHALERFCIKRQLGRGGFSTVFLAEDLILKRRVALKLPNASTVSDPQLRRRFLREAQVVANLHHPNIVPLYEADEVDGACYLASAYCPGPTLAEWLAERPEPASPRLAALIVLRLTGALAHAHQRGVLHRDVKPGNVMLDEADADEDLPFVPKLTDFGLAKLIEQVDQGQNQSTGLLGTPRYMAPEQACGRKEAVGPASDIYSLGVILYELLTKRAPIEGEGPADTLRRLAQEIPLPPRRLQPGIPRDLEAICLRCLQRAPGRRYSQASQLADDLRHFLAGRPTVARPPAWYERLGHWAQRQPVVATTLLMTLISLLLVAGLLVVHNRQLERSRALTRQNEQRARQLLYASDMRLAGQAWHENDPWRVGELLKRHLPAEGARDLRGLEWYFLRQQSVRDYQQWLQVDEPLYTLQLSPDGKLLAVAGAAAIVYLLNTDGQLQAQLPTGQKEINDLQFSPDGQWLCTAGDDGTVAIWDVAQRKELYRWTAHKQEVFGARFVPGRPQLVTCSRDQSIQLWELPSGRSLQAWKLEGRRGVESLAVSPDGTLIAATAGDDVVVWQLQNTAQPVYRHQLPGRVVRIGFSPDGQYLFATDIEGAVQVITADRGQPVFAGRLKDKVQTAAFSPDSSGLVAGDRAGTVAYWQLPLPDAQADPSSVEDGPRQEVLWHAHDDPLYAVGFGPDGHSLLTAGRDGQLRRWDLPVRYTTRLVFLEGRDIDWFTYLPDGDAIVNAGNQLVVCRLQDPNQPCEVVANSDTGSWGRLHVSRTSHRFAAGRHGGHVHVWQLPDWTPLAEFQVGDPASHGFNVALSPDGRYVGAVVTGSSKGTRIWRIADQQQVYHFPVQKGSGDAIACSPEGTQWAFNIDSDLHLLAWPSGRLVTRRRAHGTTICDIKYSHDGRLLATAGHDRLIKIWDVATGQPKMTLVGHARRLSYVCFSPDDRTLVSSSKDGTIRLWNVATGQELFTIYEDPDFVNCIQLSPTSYQLGCMTDDRRNLYLIDLLPR